MAKNIPMEEDLKSKLQAKNKLKIKTRLDAYVISVGQKKSSFRQIIFGFPKVRFGSEKSSVREKVAYCRFCNQVLHENRKNEIFLGDNNSKRAFILIFE
jgi:hypothetical protein